MYQYNATQWVLIFYIYCVFGWIFESTVVSVQQKHLVNRGFLRGPMLPIYGFGAVIMLHVALPLTGHPAAIFCAGMIVATAFEYAVGVLMETLFKVRYWDYSEHKFQFQGRICLQSSIAWGVLSVVLPTWMHRPVARVIDWLTPGWTLVVTGAVSAWFAWDVITSVRTALDLAKMLEELDRMRDELDARRAQFTAHATEAYERMNEMAEARFAQMAEAARENEAAAQLMEQAAEARGELEARLEAQRARRRQAAEERRLQLYLAMQEAEDAIEERAQRMRAAKRLIRANPSLRSRKYARAAEELHRRLRKR